MTKVALFGLSGLLLMAALSRDYHSFDTFEDPIESGIVAPIRILINNKE